MTGAVSMCTATATATATVASLSLIRHSCLPHQIHANICTAKFRRRNRPQIVSHCSHSELKPECTANISKREFLSLSFLASISLVARERNLARAQDSSGASCELKFAPSGLGYCDIVTGTGIQASEGQLIKAHYTGRLENGKIFDSSYNRGKPLTFRVGVGEVIKGWDQGIIGGSGIPPMLAGGKRTLKIPPELGYGARGAGCRGGSCVIPPNSVLLFDVEFVGKA